MGLKSRLSAVDWKFWISISLTVIFAATTIYLGVAKNRPNLIFDVITQTNALDVNEEVTGLRVLIRDTDIFAKSLNLKASTIRVSNTGSADLLPERFDDNYPLGISISTGKIVDARIIKTSSPYLDNKVSLTIIEGDKISFSKFYFPKDEYFILKLFILHQNAVEPNLRVIGNIAGLNDIPLVTSYDDATQENLFSVIIQGGFLVNVLRALMFYGIFVLFILSVVFLIAIPAEKIKSGLRKRRRKRLADRYVEIVGKPVDNYAFILADFIDTGYYNALIYKVILENDLFLRKIGYLMKVSDEVEAIDDIFLYRYGHFATPFLREEAL